MSMEKMGAVRDRRVAEYSELIRTFISEIRDLDLTGIPEPHLPVFGESYEKCSYKIAFCGMETKGWGDIRDFVGRDPEELVTAGDYTINDLEYLGWMSNYHATFWGFILQFLSSFYQIPFADLAAGKDPAVLKSFIWTNVNSVERFEVTAKQNKADFESWKKVKEASRPFDSINHILRAGNPKLVLILSSQTPHEFFLDPSTCPYGMDVSNRRDYLRLDNEKLGYRYYFRRDTGTHFFFLPHPTYMGLYSGNGFEPYVNGIISDIRNYRIWSHLPGVDTDIFSAGEILKDKCSMSYKRQFVAHLAAFLIDNDSVMSGKELQELFNRNGILTSHGYEYGRDGGRGIHRLITNVWQYYHDAGDFQTAYNIARAFVNQRGEYAYD